MATDNNASQPFDATTGKAGADSNSEEKSISTAIELRDNSNKAYNEYSISESDASHGERDKDQLHLVMAMMQENSPYSVSFDHAISFVSTPSSTSSYYQSTFENESPEKGQHADLSMPTISHVVGQEDINSSKLTDRLDVISPSQEPSQPLPLRRKPPIIITDIPHGVITQVKSPIPTTPSNGNFAMGSFDMDSNVQNAFRDNKSRHWADFADAVSGTDTDIETLSPGSQHDICFNDNSRWEGFVVDGMSSNATTPTVHEEEKKNWKAFGDAGDDGLCEMKIGKSSRKDLNFSVGQANASEDARKSSENSGFQDSSTSAFKRVDNDIAIDAGSQVSVAPRVEERKGITYISADEGKETRKGDEVGINPLNTSDKGGKLNENIISKRNNGEVQSQLEIKKESLNNGEVKLEIIKKESLNNGEVLCQLEITKKESLNRLSNLRVKKFQRRKFEVLKTSFGDSASKTNANDDDDLSPRNFIAKTQDAEKSSTITQDAVSDNSSSPRSFSAKTHDTAFDKSLSPRKSTKERHGAASNYLLLSPKNRSKYNRNHKSNKHNKHDSKENMGDRNNKDSSLQSIKKGLKHGVVSKSTGPRRREVYDKSNKHGHPNTQCIKLRRKGITTLAGLCFRNERVKERMKLIKKKYVSKKVYSRPLCLPATPSIAESTLRLNKKIDAITLKTKSYDELNLEKAINRNTKSYDELNLEKAKIYPVSKSAKRSSLEKSSKARLNENIDSMTLNTKKLDKTKIYPAHKGAKTSPLENYRKAAADHKNKTVKSVEPTSGYKSISRVKSDQISSNEPVGISNINISFQKSSTTKLSSRLQEILERRKTPLMNGSKMTSKPFVNRSTLVSRRSSSN